MATLFFLNMIKLTKTKKELLHSMTIDNNFDIINHFPYRYNRVEFIDYKNWKIDDTVVIEAAIITKPKIKYFIGNKNIINFDVSTNYDDYHISIFNRIWLLKNQIGDKLTIIGKYQGNNKILALNTYSSNIEDIIGIHPVYSLKGNLTDKQFNEYVNQALEAEKNNLSDFLPKKISDKYHFLSYYQALKIVHNPSNNNELNLALKTLKYQEFFQYSLLMSRRKQQNHQIDNGYQKKYNKNIVDEFINNLEFKLTEDQNNAISDILDDLSSNKQMCRLLQGDVGTGKSIVAFTAMYATTLAGQQAAIMAPTEILAKQHYENLKRLFNDYDINIVLLYSSLDKSQKNQIKKDIESHKANIIVGTHALFQQDVSFNNLGLVITDEQHRFGVNQRKSLLLKGNYTDVLLMSATPIPRTLIATIYGDLDISTIYQSPNQNKKIYTTLIKQNSFISKLDEITALLEQKNQMYVVCPLIEDDENSRNVMDIYNNLAKYFKGRFNVGLLHGKMNSEEKLLVQKKFQNKEIDILVSTTVIEVGIDIKDGNIMVIYEANRFGLAQLHQLRGRLARGNRDGYCYLLTSSSDEKALEKLNIIVNNTDGFKISYYDLLNRGPGDMLGTRQSGLPSFNIGNVINDNDILVQAKKDADIIYLEIEKYPILVEYLNQDHNGFIEGLNT